MRLSSFLLLAMAVVCLSSNCTQTAVAQSSLDPAPKACPVTVSAQHAPSATNIYVAHLPRSGAQQSLDLTLGNQTGQAIESMEFDVTGVTPHGRMQPLDKAKDPFIGSAEVVRRVHLQRTIGEGENAQWTISIPQMTAVTEIALISITFRTGEIRDLSHKAGCVTTPDHFMLIASDR